MNLEYHDSADLSVALTAVVAKPTTAVARHAACGIPNPRLQNSRDGDTYPTLPVGTRILRGKQLV